MQRSMKDGHGLTKKRKAWREVYSWKAEMMAGAPGGGWSGATNRGREQGLIKRCGNEFRHKVWTRERLGGGSCANLEERAHKVKDAPIRDKAFGILSDLLRLAQPCRCQCGGRVRSNVNNKR